MAMEPIKLNLHVAEVELGEGDSCGCCMRSSCCALVFTWPVMVMPM